MINDHHHYHHNFISFLIRYKVRFSYDNTWAGKTKLQSSYSCTNIVDSSSVRASTGFGFRTNSVRPVHCWSSPAHQALRPHATRLRWWHANIRIFFRPTDTAGLVQKVNACIEDVARWMQANRLQLNPTKTEILWCAPPQRQNVIPSGPVCKWSKAI